MGKAKTSKCAANDLSGKRGLPCEPTADSWDTTLVRLDDLARPTDIDTVVDRLLQRGLIGAAQRDVADQLFARKLNAPAGKWALLIKPKGQTWLWLATSWDDYRVAEDLAARAGLVTVVAGYQDTAGATLLIAYDGKKPRVEFQSIGFEGGRLRASDKGTSIEGPMHGRDWLKQFSSETEAQEALLRELDAFAPYLGVYSDKGKAGLYAADDLPYGADAFERIDLLVFGPAALLKVGEAGRKLKQAIDKLDAAAVRAAVKAGAGLAALPDSALPPLQYAISSGTKDPGRWLSVIRALLEGGADPSGPPGANPPLCELADESLIDLQTLIEGMGALLDHKADVNGRCTDGLNRGSTAVHILALTRGATPLRFLHARGVNVLGIKDAGGKTPLQACEDSFKRMKAYFGKRFDGGGLVKESIEYLRSLAKGTAGNDGYEQEAAADRIRQTQRRKEAAAAFEDLGKAVKASAKVLRRPDAEEADTVAIRRVPMEIHLVSGSRLWWFHADSRDADVKRLEKAGFKRIGVYGVKEAPMSDVRILGMIHQASDLYAAVCESGPSYWIDLVRYHQDGTRVTVTSADTPREYQSSADRERKVRLPRAGVSRLLQAMKRQKVPRPGVQPVTARQFARRVETDHREEMKDRKRAKT